MKKINRIWTYSPFLPCMLLILTYSCNNDIVPADRANLTTAVITEITATSSKSGGNIKAANGNSVTARGVCWSISPLPTIADSKTIDGSGGGSFVSAISGLSPTTNYFVRAYATNADGTAYGNEIIFTTYNAEGVSDIDGNHYQSVSIGTQVWMAENLKVTTYNDGTPIPLVTDSKAWLKLTTPGYCWYRNDEDTYKNTYGALYDWYVANTGNLCPSGWHVPTDAEWNILSDYLEGFDVAGGKLKEKGITHWNSPNSGATNESGFSALPGGFRNWNGGFFNIGIIGLWWSSTEKNADESWRQDMYYEGSVLNTSPANKNYGFSVRCVRDN